MSSDQLFSKLLVPIDGSEPSFHAARVAINIANKFNSEIIIRRYPLAACGANCTSAFSWENLCIDRGSGYFKPRKSHRNAATIGGKSDQQCV